MDSLTAQTYAEGYEAGFSAGRDATTTVPDSSGSVTKRGEAAPEPLAPLENKGHRHFDTKCPESGLQCGYWIRYYSQRATDFEAERTILAKRVHDQRAEINRLAAAVDSSSVNVKKHSEANEQSLHLALSVLAWSNEEDRRGPRVEEFRLKVIKEASAFIDSVGASVQRPAEANGGSA